jgi:hypothetical protein
VFPLFVHLSHYSLRKCRKLILKFKVFSEMNKWDKKLDIIGQITLFKNIIFYSYLDEENK